MLVGHLPHLTRLTSGLVVGDPDQEVVQFPAGTIVCIARAGEGFHVEWTLTQTARPHPSA